MSPWSTHGRLKTRGKTGAEINEQAKATFEKEMKKLKKYFRKHGVFVLVYTDADLANPEAIFSDIRNHLEAAEPTKQLRFDEIDEFFQ